MYDQRLQNSLVEQGLRYRSIRKLLEQGCSKIEQDRILKSIDQDNDGYISYQEFVDAIGASYSNRDDKMLESAFRKLDANDDGYLNVIELGQVL